MIKQVNLWYLVTSLVFITIASLFAYTVPIGEELFMLNKFRTEPVNGIIKTATLLGEWYTWLLVFTLAHWVGLRKVWLLVVGSVIVLCINYSFKFVTQKDRPFTWAQQAQPSRELVLVPDIYINKAKTSFPSGHTCSAFAAFYLICQMIPERQRPLGIGFAFVALLVGFSRIFLVQHFLVDVIGGASLGILLGWAIWSVYTRVNAS